MSPTLNVINGDVVNGAAINDSAVNGSAVNGSTVNGTGPSSSKVDVLIVGAGPAG